MVNSLNFTFPAPAPPVAEPKPATRTSKLSLLGPVPRTRCPTGEAELFTVGPAIVIRLSTTPWGPRAPMGPFLFQSTGSSLELQGGLTDGSVIRTLGGVGFGGLPGSDSPTHAWITPVPVSGTSAAANAAPPTRAPARSHNAGRQR